MSKAKSLPQGLRDRSGQRTSDSVAALHAAVKEIAQDVEADASRVKAVTLRDVIARAKLSEKFLYGAKHKDTTKPAIEAELADINARLAARTVQQAPTLTEVEKARAEAEHWKVRYEKLARHCNLWFARMREQQQVIRDLRQQVGDGLIKIVERR